MAEGIPEPPLVWYGTVHNNEGGQNIRLSSGNLIWLIRDSSGTVVKSLSQSLTNWNDQFSYVLELPCESVLGQMSPDPENLSVDPPGTYSRVEVFLDGQPIHIQPPALEAFSLNATTRGTLERIDLAFVRVEPDSDGDGLPDWWEDEHFPLAGTTPGVDSDDDGVSDGDEYGAGTDPNDPDSLFVIAIGADELGHPLVSWQSAPGKFYRVLRATSLTSDINDFVEVFSGVGATPPSNEMIDDTVTGEGPFFYLLQVE